MYIKLGFIGGGHMATSIIKGMKDSPIMGGIMVSDSSEKQREKLSAFGCEVTDSNKKLVENSDVIVLAVKPDTVGIVLDEVSSLSNGKCFISIAAGISTEYIKNKLPESAVVLRAMPNMNAEVGAGVTVLAVSENTPRRMVEFARAVFGASGTVEELPESLFPAVISVSGSSPAYFFMLADAMISAATAQGIDRETAARLAYQSMLGSARTLQSSGLAPGKLADMVATPGGTTEAALKVLKENNWHQAVHDAMKACAGRSEEITELMCK